jgi:phage repressor protein C with HTH and peptisase S24 domain
MPHKIKQPNLLELVRLKYNLNRPEMAALLKTTQQQVFHLERRNVNITEDWLKRYAKALQIDIADIHKISEQPVVDNNKPLSFNIMVIPVYGMADAANPEAITLNENSIIAYTELPAGMKVPKDSFGIIIRGESMMPRFMPGETVIVNPYIEPKKNEECLIEKNDGTAIVKIYNGRNEDCYILGQHNTETRNQPLEIPISEIKRMAAIVGLIIRR